MEDLLVQTVVASWKQIIDRLDRRFTPLNDEQFQQQVAPDKNRLFYLLGHLTCVHDRMLPLLGIGERLYPQLDEVYITNPDRALADPLTAADLKKAWSEVNVAITSAVERFSANEWLKKHSAVSEQDFIKEPLRNRLALFLSRTNHASFHAGQAVLAK
jgi:hypothetical protein